MPRRFLLLHLLDEFVHPFHHMVAAITFVATTSVASVFLAYVEPVQTVLYSFILTFPLTTGLTIIFLILFNFKWKRFVLADIFLGVGFFALLFFALNGLYSVLPLKPVTDNIEQYEAKERLADRYRDSLLHPHDFWKNENARRKAADEAFRKRHPGSTISPAAVNDNLKKVANDDANAAGPTLPKPSSEQPWYIAFLGLFITPSTILWKEITDFYRDYGAVRFWTGVVLALFFSVYINKLRRRRLHKESE